MTGSGNGASHYTVPHIIGGEERQSDKTFKIFSPATGDFVHHCASATVSDADAAVDAAATAFKSWKKSTPSQRRDIFLKAAQIMERRQEELVDYLESETGATRDWCQFNLALAGEIIKDVAGRISSLEGTFPATRIQTSVRSS